MSVTAVVLQEIAFFAIACAYIAWALWRLPPEIARFPGPRPVGPVFKAWFVVIWLVGGVLPLAALVVDGIAGGSRATLLALLPYLAMFALQIASEMFCWKGRGSPVWVIVPCLYLPWRLWQSYRGIGVAADGPLLTLATMYALFVLWVINVGVHYTNIPRAMRWDYHPRDARFPSMQDPKVFGAGAQDAPDGRPA
jgi:hypothetical protein